jgi:transposase-like protein
VSPSVAARRYSRLTIGPGSSTRPGLWRCRSCKGQFTVTKGTVFEDSRVPLTKWLLALYLLAESKKGTSAHQIRRMLKVKYQTAWFMMHRLRYAMSVDPMASKLRGVVEMDETFLGGKRKGKNGRAPSDTRKAMVVALVERDGRARAFPMPMVTSADVRKLITTARRSVAVGTDDRRGGHLPGRQARTHSALQRGALQGRIRARARSHEHH